MPDNNNRLTASQRRAQKKKSQNPFMTTSASQRRAVERAKSGKAGSAEAAAKQELDLATITEMLANPTKEVTAEDLKREYGHVVRDIRSMFLLAGGLVLLEIIIAVILLR